MKVLILGSWKIENQKRWSIKGSKGDFNTACWNLGNEIFNSGNSIIVTSDGKDTADYNVVRGYLGCPERRDAKNFSPYQRIFVQRPSESKGAYTDLNIGYEMVFQFNLPYQANWESNWEPNLITTIPNADVVITIGGGRKSYIASLAAIVANKKLVPIGTFGGAAKKILDFDISRVPNYMYKIRNDGLENPWPTNMVPSDVIKQIGINDYPRILIIHGRSTDWEKLRKHLTKCLNLPEPVVMKRTNQGVLTNIEILEEFATQVDGFIVIATPDDVGKDTLNEDGTEIEKDKQKEEPRSRQNIWFEFGLFLGLFRNRGLFREGKHSLILVKKSKEEIKFPSDLGPISRLTYIDTPVERPDKINSFIAEKFGKVAHPCVCLAKNSSPQ